MDTDPSPLREIRFDNDQLTALGIECLTLAELRRRVPPERLLAPERVDFCVLLLVTQGTGAHMVDFVLAPLQPGSLVVVRPGQVQQWQPNPGMDGPLVLMTAQALQPGQQAGVLDGLGMDEWPAVTSLPDPFMSEMAQAMQRLVLDFQRFEAVAVPEKDATHRTPQTPPAARRTMDAALVRHSAQGVLLRLGRWFSLCAAADQASGAGDRAIYRLFVRELEAGFRRRLGVGDLAARLGYSESTLSRACKAAEGRSAKQVIDRRVALEAARQLVHSSASVATIGHHLGFSEATNFVKFFGRMQGLSPQAFRQRMSLPGPASEPGTTGTAPLRQP